MATTAAPAIGLSSASVTMPYTVNGPMSARMRATSAYVSVSNTPVTGMALCSWSVRSTASVAGPKTRASRSSGSMTRLIASSVRWS